MHSSSHTQRLRWHLDDIPFRDIDKASVHGDEFLFLTLASASFVEIFSETYSANLACYFAGDKEITEWLKTAWQREEVQHGYALKAYVQTVWPEFDWEKSYREFEREYRPRCTVEDLEAHRGLELVARCVVETGTSTFYRALQDYTCEPVLRDMAGRIKADEAAHYKHFRRRFLVYNAIERHGAWTVLATVVRRLRTIRGEDAYIAFKHVYDGGRPARRFHESAWIDYKRKAKHLARLHYPYTMAVTMLIKPIPMPPPLKRMLQWPLLALARLLSPG